MKAVLLEKPGAPVVRDVPAPECPEGGILVKVRACGICAADAKMAAKGHPALVYPRVPGHEIAGVVHRSRTSRFSRGDRVQVAPGLRCGACRACLAGRDNQCDRREILGFTVDGGMAEYVAVPLEGPLVGAAHPVPPHLAFATATLAEPLACCLNAQDKAAVQAGDRVLIVGGGPLGLLHCMTARSRGAGEIWVSEPAPARRRAAPAFGASRTFDPGAPGYPRGVAEAAGSQGVDVILLASSRVAPDGRLLSLLARGGRLSVFSGTPSLSGPPRLDLGTIHYNELALTGAYGCTADQNRRALELLAGGRFPFEKLITHTTTLEGIHAGFAHTAGREGFKSTMEVADD